MKIAYLYPEKLPTKKARSISVINTSCSLSKLTDTSLIYEKSGQNILEFYNKDCNLKLIPISRKFIIRSNKIFNNNLKNYFNKFDVFYVRHLKTAEYLIKNNQFVIFEVHEFFQDTNSKMKVTEDFVLNNAKGIVVINEYLQKLFDKRFHNRTRIIRNGCGFEFNYIKKEFHKIENIYYVGSFQPWKGVEFLVENMRFFPNLILNIIGDGDKSRILEIINKYDLKNINFLGYKSQEEVQIILKKSKLTIIPNIPSKDSEFSTPIKLYEYMMSSNIVLSSNMLTIQEIIKDGKNGFLFKAGDSEDFVVKLNYILSLDNKTLQEIAKEGYETSKQFTWDNRAKQIFEFIKSIK